MVGSLQLANLHRKQCKKIQSEFTRGKDFFKQVMVGCLAIIDQQGFVVKQNMTWREAKPVHHTIYATKIFRIHLDYHSKDLS